MHLQIIARDNRLGIQSTYYGQGIANLLQVSVRLFLQVIPPKVKPFTSSRTRTSFLCLHLILSPPEMSRLQGAKWSFSLAWNIFSTAGMRDHGTKHGISTCCSLAPFCLYPPLWAGLPQTHPTLVWCLWISTAHTKPKILEEILLEPLCQLFTLRAADGISIAISAPGTELTLLSSSCSHPAPNPAQIDLSWIFGATHPFRNCQGSSACQWLCCGQRFSPFFPASNSLSLVKCSPWWESGSKIPEDGQAFVALLLPGRTKSGQRKGFTAL